MAAKISTKRRKELRATIAEQLEDYEDAILYPAQFKNEAEYLIFRNLLPVGHERFFENYVTWQESNLILQQEARKRDIKVKFIATNLSQYQHWCGVSGMDPRDIEAFDEFRMACLDGDRDAAAKLVSQSVQTAIDEESGIDRITWFLQEPHTGLMHPFVIKQLAQSLLQDTEGTVAKLRSNINLPYTLQSTPTYAALQGLEYFTATQRQSYCIGLRVPLPPSSIFRSDAVHQILEHIPLPAGWKVTRNSPLLPFSQYAGLQVPDIMHWLLGNEFKAAPIVFPDVVIQYAQLWLELTPPNAKSLTPITYAEFLDQPWNELPNLQHFAQREECLFLSLNDRLVLPAQSLFEKSPVNLPIPVIPMTVADSLHFGWRMQVDGILDSWLQLTHSGLSEAPETHDIRFRALTPDRFEAILDQDPPTTLRSPVGIIHWQEYVGDRIQESEDAEEESTYDT